MARNSTTNAAQRRTKPDSDGSTPRVRCRLNSIDDVKLELARLYREAKSGKRDVSDASKLANLLSILGRLIEGADIEAGIAALEERAAKEKNACRPTRR